MICAESRCRKPSAAGRRLCHCHAKRRYRAANPLKDAFRNLKHNAKLRGIPFDLSMDEFAALCELTGYLAGRGNGKFALTIDRIDASEGYCASNLQILSRIENTNKRNFVDYPRLSAPPQRLLFAA